MLPAPGPNPLHVDIAMEIAGVLLTPFPLARQLAGRLTDRLQTEALMPGIAPAWPEPNPTVATLSQPIRAHCLLPEENREEYDNHGLPPKSFTPTAATAADALREQKKEEDDPFGSGEEEKKTNLSDRRKKSHFKAASRRRASFTRLRPPTRRGCPSGQLPTRSVSRPPCSTSG